MSIKGVLPWVGVVAVVSMSYWFPPIYRALPTGFWMVILVVGGAFGVWQWVAYLRARRQE